jgi:hypothetical protein
MTRATMDVAPVMRAPGQFCLDHRLVPVTVIAIIIVVAG